MVIAAVVSGMALYGVHPFAKKIPESEYGVLGLLLAVLNCMGIPSLGLQMVFVQQTAAALSDIEKRRLAGTARSVLLGTFGIWLLMAALVFVFREQVVAKWQISNPAALWITVLVALAAMWSPIFGGILQGQQNFLWVGWASIFNGVGRLAAVAIIVLVFHGYAAGMVGGILIGTLLTFAVFVWQTRQVWLGPGEPFAWKPWFARVVPLTFGFGAFSFMFSADPLFVQAFFDKDQTGFYIAAGTLSRALVAFTGPVVLVMFPKIVRSVATAEKTDVMTLTLLTTGVLASLGALGLSVIAPWLLQVVYKDSFRAAVPLLPWFAWGMVPLALANVLLNDLLARSQFRVVPWLVVLVILYALALTRFHDSFLTVIRMLGGFNLAFLGATLFFARRNRAPQPSGVGATSERH